ncbi:MAG: beta strand repeat-containing protein [Phycisphaerae bacterium]
MDLRIRTARFVIAAILGTIPSFAGAASYTWTGQSGNWSDPANWAGGNVPVNDPATVVTIQSYTRLSQSITSTLDASRSVWQVNWLYLNLFSSSPANNLRIDPASLLDFVGASPVLEVATPTPIVVSGPVQLDNTLTVRGTGSRSLLLNGSISGNGGLIFTMGSGNLTLAGNNTFAGGVTVAPTSGSATLLEINQPAALGAGNLTIIRNASSFPSITVDFKAGPGPTTTITNPVVVSDLGNGTSGVWLTGTGSSNQTIVLQHLVTTSAANISLGSIINSASFPFAVGSLSVTGNLTIAGSTLALSNITETTPSVITFGNGNAIGTTSLDTANRYTGGTSVAYDATVNANVPGALGPGVVNVTGTLVLNATAAANNTVTGNPATYLSPSIRYNANGAAGGHAINITAGSITIGESVTSFGGDTFSIGAGGTVTGTSAGLAMLNRGIGGGGPSNFTAANGALLENADGGLPTVQNIGNNADLIAVVHSSAPLSFAVGTGTPWKGMNAGAAGFVGTLHANSAFPLGGFAFGDGSNASFNILSTNGRPVPVTVQTGTFNSPLSDFSGVSLFQATRQLSLTAPDALGGGNGTSPVPLDVASYANLSVSSSTAINASTALHAGVTLTINAPGLNGTGAITRDSASITAILQDANALTGSQLGPAFFHAGDIVQLQANDVSGLRQVSPAAAFYLNGTSTVTESEGFTIDGGILYFASKGLSLLPPTSGSGSGTINIGPNGGTIGSAGFGSTLLRSFSSTGDGCIGVPIIAQGAVTFGVPSPQSGAIILTNPANQLPTVNIAGIGLVAASPSTLKGATVNLNGGELALLSDVANASLPPTPYNNTINVTQGGTISDNTNDVRPASFVPSAKHPVSISTITLGNATLYFRSAFSAGSLFTGGGIHVSNLLLTGNGTVGAGISTIQNLSDNGTGPTLALQQGSMTIQGALTAKGPINVGDSSLLNIFGLEFDGTSTPSSAPITVGTSSELVGTGVLHRPVRFTAGQPEFLSPGHFLAPSVLGSTTVGTLELDSLVLSANTTLAFDLGTPNTIGGALNDLLIVDGDLTLSGSLSITEDASFGPGTYRLISYGGTLTYNGLALPNLVGDSLALDLSTPGEVNLIVTAVPEPATLAVGLAGAAFLLGRRRQGPR